ncbi:23S rRNA [guanosine-2'-O-]-methyltransferase RlmB [Octadecabacter arcticus 238]|uniref:23S rRNA [guanosine-2'-O-]-methyltransferase RlmB n=1 Tax=Octadecabacter arcticus 238 TaxID=391616 RepID=M9RGW8_9RHOB|nr:23S rRNA [guanosine-2'-O-]-methyltransferase RlmB [Octadecabacter arcticus 238]
MATGGVNLNSGSGLAVFVRSRHEGANTKECTVKKPTWVVDKERNKRAAANETVWLFGIHAVRDALLNPAREKLRFVVTKNAFDRLGGAVDIGLKDGGPEPEMCEPRNFAAPIDPQSVHQGAALEVKPLDWGKIEDRCMGDGVNPPRVVLLDKVTDPHNVGAILRSAEVFGAQAVIAMNRHAAPETGALAKTASGAMERQPYLRVRNLADAIVELQAMGYLVLGLDGEAEQTIEQVVEGKRDRAIALVLGAEGPGLRDKTKETCDALVRIDFAGEFGSLNVSNAAAVALYVSRAS